MSKFIDSLLCFECAIPAGWSELPAAWARKAKQTASATSEKLDELLKASSDPFLSLSRPGTDPYQAVPMIQCTAKPLEVLRYVGGPDKLLDASIDLAKDAYPDFKLVQRLSPYVVAGASGVCANLSMSVVNEHDVSFLCQSELIILQASRYCLIIGLTGPADPEEQLVADHDEFVRSIRLG